MSRDIKLRAWDERTIEIYTKWDEGSLLGSAFSGLIGIEGGNSKRSVFIFMQYTGLKDKNGVGIYEGDILSVPIGLTDHVKATDVFYADGAFRLQIPNFVSHPYLGEYIDTLHFEVIDNIYENPELLIGGDRE